MYRIDFEDIIEAAEIFYCFMTEQEFCHKITSTDFAAISCVASTDKADTRRVVLNLMPDTDYLILNFPSANGKPNEAARRLLKLLEI